MSKKNSPYVLGSHELNRENPFLKERIEQIQSGIVKNIKTLQELQEMLFYRR